MLRACLFAILLGACGSAAKSVEPPSNVEASGGKAPPGPLSFTALVPVGAECVLQRLHIGGTAEEIARLPSSCRGGRIAFSWDTTRCVVWFDPRFASDDKDDASGKGFAVNLATKAVVALPAFPGPDLAQMIGFTPDDRVMGFTTHDLEQATKQPKLVYLGTALDFTDIGDGMPAAAVSYHQAGGAWTLAAVDRTTDGWDYAMTWSASRFAKRLGPETSEFLSPFVESHPVELSLAAEVAKLPRSKTAQPDSDTWQRLPTGGNQRVYGFFTTGEFAYSTGLLAWETSPGHVELMPRLTGTGETTVSVHSIDRDPGDHRYLFVATDHTGERMRLYDVIDHTVILANDAALAVMPWPAPDAPPAPETDEGTTDPVMP